MFLPSNLQTSQCDSDDGKPQIISSLPFDAPWPLPPNDLTFLCNIVQKKHNRVVPSPFDISRNQIFAKPSIFLCKQKVVTVVEMLHGHQEFVLTEELGLVGLLPRLLRYQRHSFLGQKKKNILNESKYLCLLQPAFWSLRLNVQGVKKLMSPYLRYFKML